MANKKRTTSNQPPTIGGKARGQTSGLDEADEYDHELVDSSAVPTPWKRRLVSVLLVIHLAAVALPPMMFQSGGSAMVATLLRPLQAYCEFLYLDRGYAFFAPDPGPSHLFQAAITQSDGQRTETMYPDIQEQWPRLLYHRHFMLSEYLTEIYQPPGPPSDLAEIDRPAAEEWVRLRARYEHVRQSVVNHLSQQNAGKPVAIRRIEHLIPSADEFANGDFELTNPLLYEILVDRPITVGAPPMGPPEAIPAPNAIREKAAQDLTAPREPAEEDASTSPPASPAPSTPSKSGEAPPDSKKPERQTTEAAS